MLHNNGVEDTQRGDSPLAGWGHITRPVPHRGFFHTSKNSTNDQRPTGGLHNLGTVANKSTPARASRRSVFGLVLLVLQLISDRLGGSRQFSNGGNTDTGETKR